jgi:hypothetical protein
MFVFSNIVTLIDIFKTFLGILYENENEADGFRKILNHLQQFVPSYFDGKKDTCGEQAVVGDQLTVERGVNSLMEVSNGFTPEERNEGIHFEIADFHGGMKFLEVFYIISTQHFARQGNATNQDACFSRGLLFCCLVNPLCCTAH